MNRGKISRFRFLEEEDPEVWKSDLHVYTRRVDKSLSNILKKRRERLEFSFRLHGTIHHFIKKTGERLGSTLRLHRMIRKISSLYLEEEGRRLPSSFRLQKMI
jgi:hypothetical protein